MFFLAPYRGAGTILDPFRPLGAQEIFSAVDLRLDSALGAGFCVFHSPVAVLDARVTLLGLDKRDPVPPGVRAVVGNALGVVFTRGFTVGELLWDLMTVNRGTLAALRPRESDGKRYLVVNGETWFTDARAVGPLTVDPPIDPTDPFTRGDNADLGASWSVIGAMGALQIVGNAVRAGAVGVHCGEYWNVDAPPADQWSEIIIKTVPPAGSDTVAASVRTATAAVSFYYNQACTNKLAIWKVVAGSYTELTSNATNPVANDAIRLDAQGTTLNLARNAGLELSTTDADLAAGRWGINIYSPVAVANGEIETWTGGDFAAGGAWPSRLLMGVGT